MAILPNTSISIDTRDDKKGAREGRKSVAPFYFCQAGTLSVHVLVQYFDRDLEWSEPFTGNYAIPNCQGVHKQYLVPNKSFPL